MRPIPPLALALLAPIGCHEDPTHADIGGALAPAPICADLAHIDCDPGHYVRAWRFDYVGQSTLTIDEIITLDDPTPIEGWFLAIEGCVGTELGATLVGRVDIGGVLGAPGALLLIHDSRSGGFTHIERPPFGHAADDQISTLCPPDSLTATRRFTLRDGRARIERWPPTPVE